MGFFAFLWFLLKMCFETILRRFSKNKVQYFSNERTVTVRSSDGGKIVAHKKEIVEKGKLRVAEHSVSQWPGTNNPDGEVKVWSRQYGGVGKSNSSEAQSVVSKH